MLDQNLGEKGVHIIKQLLKKTTDSQSDAYLALLSYRTATLDCSLSPAELHFRRNNVVRKMKMLMCHIQRQKWRKVKLFQDLY
uniref:Uncharacterized protein n=1 Tax=Oreochromis niloticus TaxID=8128 RepID=A0A669BR33_ORENI